MIRQMNSKAVEENRAVKQEFAFDPSVFNQDDERTRLIKEIIFTRLSVQDRTYILLYAEYQAYRKLGERLGFSHTTVRKVILRIRKIILEEYEKMTKINEQQHSAIEDAAEKYHDEILRKCDRDAYWIDVEDAFVAGAEWAIHNQKDGRLNSND